MRVNLWNGGPTLALAGHWEQLRTTPGHQFDTGEEGLATG